MEHRNGGQNAAKLALDIGGISFSYGERLLLKDVNMKLYTGQIYGLIGQNGLGKSTLCNLILSEDDSQCVGKISKLLPIVTISQLLNQNDERNVLDYLLSDYDCYKEQMSLYEYKLSVSDMIEQDSLLKEYEEIVEKFEAIGGENIPHQVNKMLNRVELAHLKQRPLSVLSGGERRLVEIIRLHLNPERLLILDEPETHLDVYQVMSFCSLIKSYQGCILMVSHNRYILDNCCTRILCLSNTKIAEYNGNYSHYRKVMLSNNVANYFYSENVQKKADIERDMVTRFEEIASKSSDPAWGKRLRAKRKQLERTEKKDPGKAYLDYKNIQLQFEKSEDENSKYLIQIDNMRCSVQGRELFMCEKASVGVHDRIAIWGRNGCGKSTLFKSFLSRNKPSGLQLLGNKIGYLPQETGLIVESGMTVGEYLYNTKKANISDFMQISGYTYIDENRKFDSLSGGERMLLRLYTLTQSAYDVILLDEPTSHLDVFTQESLQASLEHYEGAFLLITHDPYWVSLLADKVWLIDKGMLYEMDLNSFHYWLQRNTSFYDTYINFVKKQRELQSLEKHILEALVLNELKQCKELLKNL